jgi:hypothetical protein
LPQIPAAPRSDFHPALEILGSDDKGPVFATSVAPGFAGTVSPNSKSAGDRNDFRRAWRVRACRPDLRALFPSPDAIRDF